ncbi:MAG: SDR family oxidoreductase [Candidatus Aminicenantes bacterium]|nr:SDR family oxidoreductase [Candidatus Aminicenantes bacterium]
MKIDFTEKVVLVTGGSRGIGAAIAEKFAEAGAIVIISFNNDKKAAKNVLSYLEGEGHNAVKCDISDPLLSEEMIERIVDEYGRIDILVNNAGIYEERSFQESDFSYWLETWERTIGLNLLGAANLSFLAGKHMVQHGGGKIINISSRGAFRGEPDAPAYGASKAALNSFSQSMAKALAPYNVQVYAVAPGFVETDMTEDILDGPRGDEIRAQSPMNRVAKPEEVANAVIMLAASGNEFMTGAIIDVNGASYLRS